MESRNEIIARINRASLADSSPTSAAAAIATNEQASGSSRRAESTLFIAGTKNPCTFFSMLPKDVTSIINAMLLTPAPNGQHEFTPDNLLEFMAEMSKDKSNAGKELFSRLKYSLEKMLYQAIIDDKRSTVKTILAAYPHILLTRHEPTIIIESPHTWQKFIIGAKETPLSVAAKRHQIGMVKLLSRHYDQLAQDKELDEASRQIIRATKIAGLDAWPVYETKKNAQDQDEIIIPPIYTDYINRLIDIFTKENLPHDTTDLTKLSRQTKAALHSLLNWLIPKRAAELDKHVDVELLLLAAYRIYNQRFYHFANEKQRIAFCVRVVGLTQSTLSPETAKVFCEGLTNVIEMKQRLDKFALQLKLKEGIPFYRSSRKSLSGLGGKYLIHSEVVLWQGRTPRCVDSRPAIGIGHVRLQKVNPNTRESCIGYQGPCAHPLAPATLLQRFYQTKTACLQELYSDPNHTPVSRVAGV